MSIRLSAVMGVIMLALLVPARAAVAAPIFWTDWTGVDTCPDTCFTGNGTITTPTATVGVTYTNPNGVGFYQPSGGTDYYVPRTPVENSPYTSTQVDNPPTGTDIIALQFAGQQTLTFTEAIANPVFSFVSLNGNGYAFLNQDFNILSLGGVDGNSCGYWGCGGASKVVVDIGGGDFEYRLIANDIGGTEPHGTLQFTGQFGTLTWRSLSNEYWNGFTVGVQGTAQEVFPDNPIPEPTSMLLLGSGLTALYARHRRKA